MNFFQEVYEVVKRIPKGKVATYGQIAKILDAPRSSRAVGYALHVNPEQGIIPCHRVVNRYGRLAPSFAFGGKEAQAELLAVEGVICGKDFIVDLAQYQWDGKI